MTPDPLTLARATPLGPYVPATEAMLRGWSGPFEAYIGPDNGWIPSVIQDGLPVFALHQLLGIGLWRLDTRRKEVRWRLVDLGLLPDALRDHPGAAVAAGMGVTVTAPFGAWHDSTFFPGEATRYGVNRIAGNCKMMLRAEGWEIWYSSPVYGCGSQAKGPETGPAGKLAADLAALRLGCVMEEADGWYIPLPDGGVGFVSKESP